MLPEKSLFFVLSSKTSQANSICLSVWLRIIFWKTTLPDSLLPFNTCYGSIQGIAHGSLLGLHADRLPHTLLDASTHTAITTDQFQEAISSSQREWWLALPRYPATTMVAWTHDKSGSERVIPLHSWITFISFVLVSFLLQKLAFFFLTFS